VGQDIDGQVVMFRYVVLTENDIINNWDDALTAPLEDSTIQRFVDDDSGLALFPDTLWTVLVVNPEEGDPKTSNIVPMSAELSDPVNTLVRQFVFVQAYDEEGAGSLVAFRAFLRNDNPPDTRIIGFLGGPFINAPEPTGSIHGVFMRWLGSDIVDYPTDPPPFEFEWRLYGPYFEHDDTTIDSTWDRIQANFIKEVFVTTDARVFRKGEGHTFDDCDTTYVDSIQVVTCSTIYVDDIESANIYGNLDTIFDIDDPAFATSDEFNRIAATSFEPSTGLPWTFDQQDIIFDVYEDEPSDTTQEQFYLFWVRSRDDALVPDLTPAFESFTVIDPQYERDVGVADLQFSFTINGRLRPNARTFWVEVLGDWAANAGITINYEDTVDYMIGSVARGIGISLRQMLARKILILVNDDVTPGLMSNPTFAEDVFIAIAAGVNTWVVGRNHIFGGEGAPYNCGYWPTLPPVLSGNFDRIFGIQQMVYSGWSGFCYGVIPGFPFGTRIEDFLGTLTFDETNWPALTIDTAALHANYTWTGGPPFQWIDTVAAMPEVNWVIRSPGTEALYLYRSFYGSRHPLGVFDGCDFRYQGRPVGIRWNRGVYRTAYFMFGVYGLERSTFQTAANSMLDWMYSRYMPPSASASSNSAPLHPISKSELRRMYFEIMEDRALRDPERAESFR
jgi:hypothetical protein